MRRSVRRTLEQVARALAPRREELPLERWRLARDARGSLQLEGVELGALLERWGSPLHVVDGERLASNAARFLALPPGLASAPEVFCSYKTNPVPGVLLRLHEAGLGAEVVSAYELWLALELGVTPERIVFNGPARSPASFALAIRREVGLINLNGRDELELVSRLARTLKKRPAIGLRVVPRGTTGGHFGERIDTGAALDAFRAALRRPELRVVALHAHKNGRIDTSESLDAFLDELLAFTDALHHALDYQPEILDVGGNLALPTVAPYTPLQQRLAISLGCEPSAPRGEVLDVDHYVQQVMARVTSHFRRRGRAQPRVFMEPGRALMGDAQLLLCRVAALHGTDAAGLTWAILDAGINVAEAVKHEFHQLFPVAPREGAPERLYRLMGPSCTLGDLLYPAWRLPELAVGDALAIMDAGAYLVPYSTCFSQPRPAIALVDGGRAELLRRPETFEDLVSLDGEHELSPLDERGLHA